MNLRDIRPTAAWLACAAVLLFVHLSSPAHAFEVRAAEDVVIEAEETVEADLYLAGDTVTIDGTVAGDVVAAARRVSVTGTVTGDLIAAGQTVEIDGVVEDDARITGQLLAIRSAGAVEGHMVAAGFHLEIEEGGGVEDDLAFTGRSLRLLGSVGGDATVSARAVRLQGAIEGSADLHVGRTAGAPELGWQIDVDVPDFVQGMPGLAGAPILPDGLEVGPDARVGGDLRIVSEAEPDVPSGVVDGELTHATPEAAAAERGSLLWDRLRRFVSLALLGVLGLALVPVLVGGAGRRIQRRTWPSLGWGALLGIGVPVVLTVVLVVAGLVAWVFDAIWLGNLGAAIVVGVGFVALAVAVLLALVAWYLAPLAAGYAGGAWLLDRFAEGRGNRFAALLIGVLAIVVLATIPVLGQIVGVAVAFFGLGGLFLALRRADASGAEGA